MQFSYLPSSTVGRIYGGPGCGFGEQKNGKRFGVGEGDETKERVWAAGQLRDFVDRRLAAEGGVADIENPDDAAVENHDAGVAVT